MLTREGQQWNQNEPGPNAGFARPELDLLHQWILKVIDMNQLQRKLRVLLLIVEKRLFVH